MVVSQYTSDFSNNINNSFYWFKKVLFAKLKERAKEFLLTDFNLKLVGISENDNVFFVGEDYFVTRIKADKIHEMFFRISAPLMNIILENSLGAKNEPFAPERITELEAKILTSLNDYIYKGIQPFLVKATEENTNNNLAHLTLIAESSTGILGKFILSIPIAILPTVRPLAPQQNFDLNSFPKYKIPVKIITGKSQLTLYDIQHIESGDIVVLEESNIKTMAIEIFGNRTNFTINPDTSIIAGIDDNGGKSEMANSTNNSSMWDVIPVEISAEFEKVSISLGELKQISEGVIVDVGTIYENKIYLKVENKPIASGELIIINDKYAVRVDEVYAEKPTPKPAPQKPTPKPQAAPQQRAPQPAAPAPQQEQANDDFNYDNFDIEDEDI